MIATGTDVKPLECLLFMRNIRSLSYFEQMKGRGCRVIDPDALQMVTPDAKTKTHFVIVDAVGVCEEDKSATKPLDRKPTVALDKIMALVAAGAADADLVSTLAARLARLDRQLSPARRPPSPRRRAAKTSPTLCGGPAPEHRPRRDHAKGASRNSRSPKARSRPRSNSSRSSRSRCGRP